MCTEKKNPQNYLRFFFLLKQRVWKLYKCDAIMKYFFVFITIFNFWGQFSKPQYWSECHFSCMNAFFIEMESDVNIIQSKRWQALTFPKIRIACREIQEMVQRRTRVYIRREEKLDCVFKCISLKLRLQSDGLSHTHTHTHTPKHPTSPPCSSKRPCRCARVGDYRHSHPIMGWLFRCTLIDWGDMQMGVIWDDKGCGRWMPLCII